MGQNASTFVPLPDCTTAIVVLKLVIKKTSNNKKKQATRNEQETPKKTPEDRKRAKEKAFFAKVEKELFAKERAKAKQQEAQEKQQKAKETADRKQCHLALEQRDREKAQLLLARLKDEEKQVAERHATGSVSLAVDQQLRAQEVHRDRQASALKRRRLQVSLLQYLAGGSKPALLHVMLRALDPERDQRLLPPPRQRGKLPQGEERHLWPVWEHLERKWRRAESRQMAVEDPQRKRRPTTQQKKAESCKPLKKTKVTPAVESCKPLTKNTVTPVEGSTETQKQQKGTAQQVSQKTDKKKLRREVAKKLRQESKFRAKEDMPQTTATCKYFRPPGTLSREMVKDESSGLATWANHRGEAVQAFLEPNN